MNAALESILAESTKRISTLQLIKETCDDEVYFLNLLLLTDKDLHNIFDRRRYSKRAANFYILGLSLSALLEWSDGPEYMKAIDALLHEYEIYVETTGHRQSKGLPFWSSNSRNQPQGEYVYLKVPFLSFELDHSEVVIILCETIVQVYQKFIGVVVEQDQRLPLPSAVAEIFFRLDSIMRKIVVTPLMAAYESYCRAQIRSELEELELICTGGL
ncbi:hypothetical protein V1525DRAFT_407205 [Lipomyces kononenkoae]|uniref:Uncharacterized protein n=1 Tax=Lipomyces kononenkoae TaxID=34357 RepID=A0ACC3SY79_LIPKO